jgi:hypothetical protein
LTCTNNASKKTATLQLQLPRAAAVTYAVTGAAPPVISDNPAGTLTLTVTATYTDQTDASAQITLTKETNGKIDCP